MFKQFVNTLTYSGKIIFLYVLVVFLIVLCVYVIVVCLSALTCFVRLYDAVVLPIWRKTDACMYVLLSTCRPGVAKPIIIGRPRGDKGSIYFRFRSY